jgi:hypothetical protein
MKYFVLTITLFFISCFNAYSLDILLKKDTLIENESYLEDEDYFPALPTSLDDFYEGQILPVEKLRNCFSNVRVIISSNSNSGHNCNAAIFTLYANDVPLKNYEYGDIEINLNNANSNSIYKDGSIAEYASNLNKDLTDLGGFRSSTIYVNNQLAKNVINDPSDPTITLYLECSTPKDIDRGWGFGGCHSNVPYVKVLRKDNLNNKETIIFKGIPDVEISGNRVRLITFHPCINN